jgi:hypothetical protein
MDKAYLLAHASPFERNLALAMEQKSPVRYYPVGEGFLEFFFEQERIGVKVLDDTHDHTDSYHLEAELDKATKVLGIEVIFIQEYDGLEYAVEKIEKRLVQTSNK